MTSARIALFFLIAQKCQIRFKVRCSWGNQGLLLNLSTDTLLVWVPFYILIVVSFPFDCKILNYLWNHTVYRDATNILITYTSGSYSKQIIFWYTCTFALAFLLCYFHCAKCSWIISSLRTNACKNRQVISTGTRRLRKMWKWI